MGQLIVDCRVLIVDLEPNSGQNLQPSIGDVRLPIANCQFPSCHSDRAGAYATATEESACAGSIGTAGESRFLPPVGMTIYEQLAMFDCQLPIANFPLVIPTEPERMR